MDLVKWMGVTFARFVGLTVIILGTWIFVANAVEVVGSEGSPEWWVTTWILASGLAGAIGGLLYMLSLDGPLRFRARRHRSVGWALMVLASLLPTSIRPMLLTVVLATVYTLFAHFPESIAKKDTVTSG